jgi:Family of unknown function (DUF5522)/Cysteine-rich CWC
VSSVRDLPSFFCLFARIENFFPLRRAETEGSLVSTLNTSVSSVRKPSPSLSRDERCPVCGGDNQCRMAKGHLYKGYCWCDEITVPSHILRVLASSRVDPACLCRACLETAARLSLEMNNSATAVDQIRTLLGSSQPALKKEDYYVDENGNLVFTAAYHLNRGTCCGNGCRHCPY